MHLLPLRGDNGVGHLALGHGFMPKRDLKCGRIPETPVGRLALWIHDPDFATGGHGLSEVSHGAVVTRRGNQCGSRRA